MPSQNQNPSFHELIIADARFEGRYCLDSACGDKVTCRYKTGPRCGLFGLATGYDEKEERALRVDYCLNFFGLEPTTRKTVEDYLKTKLTITTLIEGIETEDQALDRYIAERLKLRTSVFGDMTALEFAAEVGWPAVLGVFKRVYG